MNNFFLKEYLSTTAGSLVLGITTIIIIGGIVFQIIILKNSSSSLVSIAQPYFMSADDVIAQQNDQGFAKIYEIERMQNIYEIKGVDNDGKIIVFHVDAKTGRRTTWKTQYY